MARSSPYDVVVAGGGPAGIGAAVAAARMGASTALFERHPLLGGMGTVALVNNFCPAHWDGERLIIGGIFGELRRRLIARRALYVTGSAEPYAPEVFREEVAAMCREAGVETFLESPPLRVEFPEGAEARFSAGDAAAGRARVVVDATGDAHVAAAAGVPFVMGRASDHAVMPLTYCYILGPVDLEKAGRAMPTSMRRDEGTGETYLVLEVQDWLNARLREARARGEVRIPRDDTGMCVSVPGRPDHLSINFGRVFIKDPTDPAQLAAAEAEGRRQVEDGIRFFRKHVPGFEGVGLVELARQIGVRESRHIAGRYTLTGRDVIECRQFEDVVAQCWYPIDIHEPNSDSTTLTFLPRGKHYDIPWRCLIPREGPPNLVVGGRSISATQEAMSSLRVSPSAMAIGEAAGVTAALACANGNAVGKVDPSRVQARLRASGGILD